MTLNGLLKAIVLFGIVLNIFSYGTKDEEDSKFISYVVNAIELVIILLLIK